MYQLYFQNTTSLPSWPTVLQVDTKCSKLSNVSSVSAYVHGSVYSYSVCHV